MPTIPGIYPVPASWRPLRYTPSLAMSGRLLLFSDTPEIVHEYGVLYQETPIRPFRVFLHHVNSTAGPAGIYICIKNQRHAPAAITARATGAAWGASPMAAGQDALFMYLHNTRSETVTVPPGAWARWGVPDLLPGYTFSGMYDFDPAAPLAVYTALAPPGADPDPDTLPLLPRDADHERGTFNNATRSGQVAYQSSQGHMAFQLGNNPGRAGDPDHWQRPLPGEFELGWSTPDARTVQLLGNYGVNYMLEFNLINDRPDPWALSFVLEPRGGAFLGPLEFDGRPVVPPGVIRAPGWAWWCHGVTLAPAAQRTVRLRWVPPGGSFLPVRLHLLPEPVNTADAGDR